MTVLSVQIIREERDSTLQQHNCMLQFWRQSTIHKDDGKWLTPFGPAQQYHLNTNFPTGYEGCHINTLCLSTICSPDCHKRSSRSGTTCHSHNQQSSKRRPSTTHFSNWETRLSKFSVGETPWRWRQNTPLSYHYIPDDNLYMQKLMMGEGRVKKFPNSTKCTAWTIRASKTLEGKFEKIVFHSHFKINFTDHDSAKWQNIWPHWSTFIPETLK